MTARTAKKSRKKKAPVRADGPAPPPIPEEVCGAKLRLPPDLELPAWWKPLEAACAAFAEALAAPPEGSEAQASDGPDRDTALPSAADATAEAEIIAEVSPAELDTKLPPPDKRRTPTAEIREQEGELPEDARQTALIEKRRASWESLETLHDDIHRLFRLGDIAGALISLERLVVLSGRETRIDAFLTRNEERLLELYNRIFEGFDHEVTAHEDSEEPMGPDLRKHNKIKTLWMQAKDGGKTLQALIESSKAPKVETAALLHHLLRTRRLRFDPKE